jgi:arylsulfatase A-like enzyme
MNRRDFLKTTGMAATGALAAQSAKNQPNIVIILADDMGFSDLGCYGSEIRTPNIDTLAKDGLRFTQFYNTTRCCPTRAALLTGLYPHQTGVGHMVDTPKALPGYTGDLNTRCVTIAEVLRSAGYGTYISGKWHVTPITESKHNWPLQRGFDHHYGIIHGAASYFDPVTLTRDNEMVKAGDDYYFTDAIADNAVSYIKSAAAAKKPFLLYAAFTAPHWPLHAKPQDIARYKGRYKDGWDALREERRKKMIELGIVRPNSAMTDRDPSVPAWTDAKDKEWQQSRMEVYAAMVDSLDQNVGKILDALRTSGQDQNTLVLFLADNGGCAEELGPRASGLHVPQTTRKGEPVRRGNDPTMPPGAEETYQSYGVPWANASNTPFRLYKHWVHEGGISSPLIARWPGKIKPGGITHETAHLIDIMATCVDLSGAKYPSVRQGLPVQPMEGISMQPAFLGGKLTRRNPLFWEHEGNRAIREGRWKLVARFPGEWELYDIEADRSERINLAGKHPDRVRSMAQAWDRWAARANVRPWDEVQKLPKTPAPLPSV